MPRYRSTSERPHWSYSQLAQYLRCPLQYYFERALRLPRPFTPSGMALGSAVHEGLAEYHRVLQAGRVPAAAEIRQTLIEAWDSNEHDRPVQYREGENRVELLDQGLAVLETYMSGRPPENIVAVEQPMMVPLQNSAGEFLDKPLLAVIDLLTREAGSLTVTEFKTSGRRFNEFEADSTLQASCYAHAVQQRYGEPASLKYTVLVKTKKPTIQRLETARSDADLCRLGDTVQAVERAISAEAFYPVESSMNCSGCPYRLPCRDWCGTKSPAGHAIEAHLN